MWVRWSITPKNNIKSNQISACIFVHCGLTKGHTLGSGIPPNTLVPVKEVRTLIVVLALCLVLPTSRNTFPMESRLARKNRDRKDSLMLPSLIFPGRLNGSAPSVRLWVLKAFGGDTLVLGSIVHNLDGVGGIWTHQMITPMQALGQNGVDQVLRQSMKTPGQRVGNTL